MWSIDDVPSQAGRVAVVTGASAGIGFATAKALAKCGCHVVLAVRDPVRGADAAARVGGSTAVIRLDLAALDSVRSAATEVTGEYPRIDLLINNAGAWSATRAETRDGFELQLGVNHLGHFAFTGLVLGAMLAMPASRIVTVSSSSASCVSACPAKSSMHASAASTSPRISGVWHAPTRSAPRTQVIISTTWPQSPVGYHLGIGPSTN